MAGYIGSQTPVVSNGSQRKYTFTATAAQTVFTGMDIPNPQQIQVFQNGVRLVITTDYTVSSGTTVTLVNAASAGDSLVVILFADYQLLDTDALTFTGGTTIEGGLTVDNDGATVLTVDRASTDGAIIDVQKNGSSIGGIGVAATDDVYFAGGTGSTKGIYLNDNGVLPATTGGSASDATVDLGNTVLRWKDLYLSGGVYLGGTGSANHLDDYEEGTWTPYLGGTSSDPTITYTSQDGKYVKVGTMVTLHGRMGWSAKSGGSGFLRLAGFPFNGDHAGTEPAVNFSFTTGFGTTSAPVQGGCVHGNNWAYVYRHASSDARDNISSGLLTGDLGSSGTVYFTITYRSV